MKIEKETKEMKNKFTGIGTSVCEKPAQTRWSLDTKTKKTQITADKNLLHLH